MTSGGLLHDPGRILHDESFQRATLTQLAVIGVVLILSAFYHYVLRPKRDADEGCYDEDVAEVDALVVYPLKSGRGIVLQDAQVSRKGFKYDRRWALVKVDGRKKLNLAAEPRITHIIPSIDEEANMLRLRIGDACDVQLPEIGIPLDTDVDIRSTWPLVDKIAMYGDSADGREPPLAPGQQWQWDKSPSEWASKIIGYPVHLLQFEPESSNRSSFPVDKPPHDVGKWDKSRANELQSSTKLEFQDIYPLLVTTRESLADVESQIDQAVTSGEMKMDHTYWDEKQKQPGYFPMQRFRPNIVLKTRYGQKSIAPFSEDSWETVWIGNDAQSALPVHLVARCDRCLLTTVDPETAHRDPNVPLALLRKTRNRFQKHIGNNPRDKPCFGMYAVPEQVQGTYTPIHTGHKVRVRWRPYRLDDEVQYGRRKRQERSRQ